MTHLATMAVGLLAWLGATSSAAGYVHYTTDGGIPLHWLTGPVDLFIASDLPADLDAVRVEAAADAALSRWIDLGCAPFEGGVAGFRSGLSPEMTDGTNAVVWIHDEDTWTASYSATEIARTVVTHRIRSGEIVDADVLINVGGFTFSDAVECAPNAYDLQATLTHELGHLFGLDHSAQGSATMDPSTDPGVCDKRALDGDDVEGFCAIYAPYLPEEPAAEAVAEAAPDASASDAAEQAATTTADPSARLDDCSGGGAAPSSLLWLVALGLTTRATWRGRRARR